MEVRWMDGSMDGREFGERSGVVWFCDCEFRASCFLSLFLLFFIVYSIVINGYCACSCSFVR